MSCPSCVADLVVPDHLAGKGIHCKECRSVVRVPGTEVEKAKEQEVEEQGERAKVGSRKGRSLDDEDDENRVASRSTSSRREREPALLSKRPRSRRKRSKSSGPPVGLIIGGTVALLIAGVVAITLVLVLNKSGRENNATTGASNGDSTPNSQPGKPVGPSIPSVSAVPLVFRPALPAGWVDFQHPNKEYSVYLPGKPHREFKAKGKPSSQLTAISGGVYIDETWEAESQGKFAVNISKSVGPPDGLKYFYDSMASPQTATSLGPNVKYTINRITWVGKPAIEHIIDFNSSPKGASDPTKMNMYSRYLLFNDRVYHFTLRQDGYVATPADREAFFDSVIFGK
jgi:hypothetical protein